MNRDPEMLGFKFATYNTNKSKCDVTVAGTKYIQH
jgi:hypothetical protein